MSKSVDRAMGILDLVGERPMSVAALAKEFEIDRSTMSRIIQTLEQGGYVHRRSDGNITIGYKLMSLAHSAFDQVELRRAAYVPLRQLQQITGVTVHLAELVGNDVLYIDKAESLDGVGLYSRIGQPLPVHATAVGKAILSVIDNPKRREELLGKEPYIALTEQTVTMESDLFAQLKTARESGWAVDDREMDPLVNCVAVPILNHRRVPVGAISLTSLSTVNNVDSLLEYATILTRMATTVSAALPHV